MSDWSPAGGMGMMPALRTVARALLMWAGYLARGGKPIDSAGRLIVDRWLEQAIISAEPPPRAEIVLIPPRHAASQWWEGNDWGHFEPSRKR